MEVSQLSVPHPTASHRRHRRWVGQLQHHRALDCGPLQDPGGAGCLKTGPQYSSSVIVLGWQTYDWLRLGIWTDLNLAWGLTEAGLPVPQSSWLGIQKILDWFLSLPLAVSLGAVSFAWYASGMLLAIALTPAERK
jgi:hypothetical protein